MLALGERFGISGKFILGVGYEPRKNIPLLIEAFSLIASSHPEHSLVIVRAKENRRLTFL